MKKMGENGKQHPAFFATRQQPTRQQSKDITTMTDNKTKTGSGHDDLRRLTSATNLAVMAAEMLDRQAIEMTDEAARAGMRMPWPVTNALRSIRLGARQLMRELRIANEEHPRGPFVAVSGCPVGCLRAVQEDGTEVFLGAIEFTRCGFPDLLDRKEQERLVSKNESRKRGDPEIVWCFGGTLA